MFLCDCVYHVCADILRGQKTAPESLELWLQVGGSHWMWALVAELRSSPGAGGAFNCCAVAQAPWLLFFVSYFAMKIPTGVYSFPFTHPSHRMASFVRFFRQGWLNARLLVLRASCRISGLLKACPQLLFCESIC